MNRVRDVVCALCHVIPTGIRHRMSNQKLVDKLTVWSGFRCDLHYTLFWMAVADQDMAMRWALDTDSRRGPLLHRKTIYQWTVEIWVKRRIKFDTAVGEQIIQWIHLARPPAVARPVSRLIWHYAGRMGDASVRILWAKFPLKLGRIQIDESNFLFLWECISHNAHHVTSHDTFFE